MLIMSNACVIVFLRWEVLEQKDWKLSLEIKSKEYISVFPLIFQLPLDVLCSYKALINKLATAAYIESVSRAIFFIFQLITYH